MKIQFASDFHLEFDENATFLKQMSATPCGDVLVLAGDIFVLDQESVLFQEFVDWCSENFRQTFIVPGNHEYYGGTDISTTLSDWELVLRSNVRYVNNKSVVLDGVEFFFTTLWARVPAESEAMVNKYMPECRLAQLDGKPFRADRYTHLHEVCLGWLDKALAASTASKKVVVTHHCPVRVEDPKYGSNGLSSAFVNAMEAYVEASGVDAWVFGHTHYNGALGMKLGSTVLCTNQLGYVSNCECDGFAASHVFEI